MVSEKSYELIIQVNRATIFGGGYPNYSYVECMINGEPIGQTQNRNPPVWNYTISKVLDELDPEMLIVLVVYKKRWTERGFKLVGTAEFYIRDIVSSIGKGSIVKEYGLRPGTRNVHNFDLSGNLMIEVELREINSINQLLAVDEEDLMSDDSRMITSANGWKKSMFSTKALKKVLIPQFPTLASNSAGENEVDEFEEIFDFENLDKVEPEVIDEKYGILLKKLSTPQRALEELMQSLNTAQKMEKLQQYKEHLAFTNNSKQVVWGERENKIMKSIQMSPMPDFENLASLRTILSFANQKLMTSFIATGGLSILLEVMGKKMTKLPIKEVDMAVIYEILLCLTSIMNSPIGMEGVFSTQGAVEQIIRLIRFDFKACTVTVLEMLSVCCYYTEQTAEEVVKSFRLYAKAAQEAPFACLIHALATNDIEVKAAVIQLINSMIMSVGDMTTHCTIRNDLRKQGFGEKLEDTIKSVNSELALFEQIVTQLPADYDHHKISSIEDFELSGNTKRTSLSKPPKKRKSVLGDFKLLHSLVIYYGNKAEKVINAEINHETDDDAATDYSNTSSSVTTTTTTGRMAGLESDRNDEHKQLLIKLSGNSSMIVVPSKGTMAGILTAGKKDDTKNTLGNFLFGSDMTKTRWYELDHEFLKSCAGATKDYDFKKYIPIASITDIRAYTHERNIINKASEQKNVVLYSFEIETTDRKHAFSCESEAQKNYWLTALQVAWENIALSKGNYKAQWKEMTVAEVRSFAAKFMKQASVYHSMALEDRKFNLTSNGLDLNDVSAVSKYLVLEALASGNSDRLLAVLLKLLLIPVDATGMWDAVAMGIQNLLDLGGVTDPTARQGAFNTQHILEALNVKAKEGGVGYSQVNKLALFAVQSEQEIEFLRAKILDLESVVKDQQLEDGIVYFHVSFLHLGYQTILEGNNVFCRMLHRNNRNLPQYCQ